jgi:spore coat protein CotF
MSEPLNASFIPKRNPNRTNRQNATQRVFLGTLIIQILFFSTLLATLGVFVYEKNLKKSLDSEIITFNNEIRAFSEEEMKRVIDLDNRMDQVENRLAHTASIVSIFEALEVATVQSIQIRNFNLKRVDDSHFTIDSAMETDTFDSVMFQRGVLERDKNLSVTKVSDLKLTNPVKTEGSDVDDADTVLNFKASLAINIKDVPHKTSVPVMSSEIVVEEEVVATSTEAGSQDTLSEEGSNQENI